MVGCVKNTVGHALLVLEACTPSLLPFSGLLGRGVHDQVAFLLSIHEARVGRLMPCSSRDKLCQSGSGLSRRLPI